MPVDLGEFACPVHRVILSHQAEICLGSQLVVDPAEHPFNRVDIARQDEKADQQSFFSSSIFTHPQMTYLPEHLLYCCFGPCWIVRGVGIAARHCRIGILEVGQVDVHKAFKCTESFRILIGVAVPDDRKDKSGLFSGHDRHPQLGGILSGGNEVHIVSSLFLQFQHEVGNLFPIHLLTTAVKAQLVILAEDAAHIAVGEKDGSAAAGSADERLLPVMELSNIYGDFIGRPAISFTAGSVHPASSRANVTGFHGFFAHNMFIVKEIVFYLV